MPQRADRSASIQKAVERAMCSSEIPLKNPEMMTSCVLEVRICGKGVPPNVEKRGFSCPGSMIVEVLIIFSTVSAFFHLSPHSLFCSSGSFCWAGPGGHPASRETLISSCQPFFTTRVHTGALCRAFQIAGFVVLPKSLPGWLEAEFWSIRILTGSPFFSPGARKSADFHVILKPSQIFARQIHSSFTASSAFANNVLAERMDWRFSWPKSSADTRIPT